MALIVDAAAAALRRIETRFYRDEETGALVVPVVLSDADCLLIGVHADEDAHEAMLETELCSVPPGRQAAVALLLADLNARFKFVVFSMARGRVHVDVCVELTSVSDTETVLGLSFIRLIRAIAETHRDIYATAQRKRTRMASHMERDINTVLDDLNF